LGFGKKCGRPLGGVTTKFPNIVYLGRGRHCQTIEPQNYYNVKIG